MTQDKWFEIRTPSVHAGDWCVALIAKCALQWWP